MFAIFNLTPSAFSMQQDQQLQDKQLIDEQLIINKKLWEAIKVGDLVSVETALKQGAQPDALDTSYRRFVVLSDTYESGY